MTMINGFSTSYFQEGGPFTRIDGQVRVKAFAIKRRVDNHDTNRTSYVGEISKYVSSIPEGGDVKGRDFRKRTASQIIASDYVTGCSDVAIVFSALARALHIPTIYVETFEKAWVEDLQNFDKTTDRQCKTVDIDRGGISSHSFVDVNIHNKWCKYEPKQGLLKDEKYVLNGCEYLEVGRGLDFGALFLKENDMYQSVPVRLQFFREAILLFRPDADSLPLYNELYVPLREREKLLSAQKAGLLLDHPVRE